MRASILVDLDGVVSDTEVVYDRVLDDFADLMDGFGYHPAWARKSALQADLLKARAGEPPHRGRFPSSMAEAYQAMAQTAGRAAHPAVMRECYNIGLQVYDMRAPLMEGAAGCVDALAELYDLHIYTMGIAEVQRRRVAETGLADRFASVQILRHKDARTLGGLLRDMARRDHPAVRWVIGNSPRSDILPALACGLRALLVGRPGYEYDAADLPETGYTRAHRMIDVPAAIKAVEEGNPCNPPFGAMTFQAARWGPSRAWRSPTS